MVEVLRMPSYAATDSLQCESYTTSRAQSDEEDCGVDLKRDAEPVTNRGRADDKIVRQRDGVRSAPPSHFSSTLCENLTEKLLEDSEQRSVDDTILFESSVLDDWCEAASGWRHVVPYPKYVSRQPQQSKAESSIKKGSGRHVSVRCVDDDFGNDFMCPAWKANVEPVTYRYIPNNGCYRNSKSNSRESREWLLARKSRAERAVGNVTPELRQAQKALKKDLDNHFKGGSDSNSQLSSQQPQQAPQQPQPLPEQSDKACTQQTNSTAKPEGGQSKKYSYSGKQLLPKEQLLMKSASDLFMENFNSRLSALEKEIHTSYAPVQSRKPQDMTTIHPTLNLTKKIREARVPDTPKSMTQTILDSNPNISGDLFTVIPMCKPEMPLRPLEKLTPKQKQIEQSSGTGMSMPQSLSSTPEIQTKIILASAATQPQPTHRDSDASQGINTARSAIAMTNIDIEKMRMRPSMDRHVPLRPEFHTRAKSFLVQQGHAMVPTARKQAMRYTTMAETNADQNAVRTIGEESVMDGVRATGRTGDKQFDSMGGNLPEIMGKRLTVGTTSHRLL